MPKIFERLGMSKPRYSAFDLSHEKKLSCKMGDLIPVYLEEIVPGDQFKVSTEIMMRFSPMLAPIMHRVNVWVHYFFVPNRIIWNQWEDFITGGREGTSTPTFPQRTINELETELGNFEGKLPDYLGLPSVTAGAVNNQFKVSELPFRAYQQIFLDYYRDRNLLADFDYTTDIGALTNLRPRYWEKDYFTSCLPWSQRGAEVEVPVEGTASVDWDNQIQSRTVDATTDVGLAGDIQGVGAGIGGVTTGGLASKIINFDELDVSDINVSINELRRTSAIQRWLEKQARGGSRYIETILTHFGVRSSDQRLQRAEFLGGGRQPVVFSEVLNTTGTAEAAQGTTAGHGISVGETNSFKAKFEEHGYVLGIMSVLPKTNYQQGIPRHFQRADKLDFYWPELANLGEQEVKNAEIYYDQASNDGSNNETFGYQQRYAEYKYGCSMVHGDFRSSLDFWHMGRKFDTRPSLNNTFVKSDPTNRIFAVTTGDHLWVQVYNNVKARRPMPYFANPQLS